MVEVPADGLGQHGVGTASLSHVALSAETTKYTAPRRPITCRFSIRSRSGKKRAAITTLPSTSRMRIVSILRSSVC